MAVRSIQNEADGFTLLEEDALDERPCPAVKKFVATVLDCKTLKDQDVACRFRSLTEYRDPTSSPSVSSVAATAHDGARLHSPPSPSSPRAACPMDDQRLPNELFDEICEDIGMKEGMELDFVEYLMEQDTHLYMNHKAISSFNSTARSSMSTPTGSTSGSSNSGPGSNNNRNHHQATFQPCISTTTPNFLLKQQFSASDWSHQLPTPVVHSNHSSGSTTVQSSENNSPASKRVHLSASTETSPNKGRSQTPPGFNQHSNTWVHTSNHNLFKVPQVGALMAKRSLSCPQGAPTTSPVQSTNSDSGSSQGSSHSSTHPGFSRSYQPVATWSSPPSSCQPSDCSDQEDQTPATDSRKNPNPLLPPVPDSSSQGWSQAQFQSESNTLTSQISKQTQPVVCVKPLYQPPQTQNHNYQRWMGTPQTQVSGQSVPKNFNSMGTYPGRPFHGQQAQYLHHLNAANDLHSSGAVSENSLQDQGYFSNESAGNCSNSSAPSPAFTSSSMSSVSSVTTVMPADHKISLIQQQTNPPGTSESGACGHKSVHFADSPPVSTDTVSIERNKSAVPGRPSLCAFQVENDGQFRVNPSGQVQPQSIRSDVASYSLSNNQGPVGISAISRGYMMVSRPTCAVSVSGGRSSPGDSVQNIMCKPSHSNPITGVFSDDNGRVMQTHSLQEYPQMLPPHISLPPGEGMRQIPSPGDSVRQQQEQSRMGEIPLSSMQQPAAHLQQFSYSTSSAEPLPPPPPPHHHMQQSQHLNQMPNYHHHMQQPHPLSSCSYTRQGLSSPHNGSMRISHDRLSGSFHESTPSTRTDLTTRVDGTHTETNACLDGPQTGTDTHIGGTYPCPTYFPACDNTYKQSNRPDVYLPQQPQKSRAMVSNVRPPVHGDWAPGDLHIQVGNMQSSHTSMKGGLQHPHSQDLSHMEPSPTPACPAPVGPEPQDLIIMSFDTAVPHTQVGPHPEYGPCTGRTCHACQMSQTCSPHDPHMKPCHNPNCHLCQWNQHPHAEPHSMRAPPHVDGPCNNPSCTTCSGNQISRPHMLSSQQKFIQKLILDEGNFAYRSHPLFPLLRDLVIAEMNFDNPNFHYQPLLSLLPHNFHKLLHNFLHRNPPSGHYQSNQAIESVIMDSLRLAHGSLVGKIRHRQQVQKIKPGCPVSLRSMEEFCHKFDQSVTGPMGNNVQQVGQVHGTIDEADMFGSRVGHPVVNNKAESKKHPSLPKEAVAVMMEWLRNHKDNPYPNDDEKAMLIKQTGLSINQINYWFTNARRRILPKWAQCKT